jgi:hypothetical protein
MNQNQGSALADSILSADDGAVVRQLSRQFGLSEAAMADAIRSLAPALARGLGRETERPDGGLGLADALATGDHQRYIAEPAILERPATTEDGNKILGHVFGSKDVSRNVATFASEQTGLDTSLLKRLLPVLAPIVMGILAQQLAKRGGQAPTAPAPQPRAAPGRGGGLLDALGGLLDTNRDGSMLDDLLGMAGRAMQSRR